MTSDSAPAVPMRRPHPVTSLRALMFPSVDADARHLLATPGLELTFNARGALLIAFLEIAARGRRRVLLPAFHCPSAVVPALLAGLEPVYYRIRPDLTIDTDDLLAKADATTAAVLVIHFFGIAPDLTPLAQLQAKGVALVEDCSHSFIQTDPLELAGSVSSEYRIYSFWKTVPCGVGGGLLRAAGREPTTPRHTAPVVDRLRNYKLLLEESIDEVGPAPLRAAMAIANAARSALRPKPAQMAHVEPDRMRGEDYYPTNAVVSSSAMPEHCRRIIAASPLASIAAQRRRNFAHYAQALGGVRGLVLLEPQLPVRACPWVFPLLIENRAGTDQRLKSAGVPLHTFGIYLHSSLFAYGDSRAVADARLLADRVLCLAVHQDLAANEIDANADIVLREFEGGG